MEKHGAKEVSLWRLQGSKINNMLLSARCDNMKQMGKCMDGLAADQGFPEWKMKYFDTSTMKENVTGI